MVANAYFADKNGSHPRWIGDLFHGTIDGLGNITVCGASYAYITEFKTDFIDSNKVERNIHDILVELQDFPEIARALSENEVEFGPTDVVKSSDPSIHRARITV